MTALGDAQGRGLVTLHQHHRELIAADTKQFLAAAQYRGNAARDDIEHLVADAVSVGIIDRLEVIDVEQRETDANIAFAQHRRQVLHEFVEGTAVLRPGQRIMMRHGPQLLALLLQAAVDVDQAVLILIERGTDLFRLGDRQYPGQIVQHQPARTALQPVDMRGDRAQRDAR